MPSPTPCPTAPRRPLHRRRPGAALALLAAVLLGGCASVGVVPNAQLHVEGVPTVPTALARAVSRYADVQGHYLVDWHPQRRELLLSHRAPGASTLQLYRQERPLGPLMAVSQESEPVHDAHWEPAQGRWLLFERASGGSEVTQIHRVAATGGPSVPLTSPDERHDMGPWVRWAPSDGPAALRMVVSSVPLDRTAGATRRQTIDTRLWLLDPEQGGPGETLAVLPGGGWGAVATAPDQRSVALQRYLSANASEIWLQPMPEAGRPAEAARRLLPAPGDPSQAVHRPVEWTPDGRGLLFISDRAGEFRELMHLDLASGRIRRLTPHIPWDVQVADASAEQGVLLLRVNEDGRETLRRFDLRTLEEVPLPALPPGTVVAARLHPRSGETAVALAGPSTPSQIWTLDPAGGPGAVWTQAGGGPAEGPAAPAPQRVHWTSFDGRRISGLLTLPDPARWPGRRPVLIDFHGGPEGQAQEGFLGRRQYLVDDLGIALLQPNVRGSSGYGKTFLRLDNGLLREDAVRDASALLDWLPSHPRLDAGRVVVSGGSYGGYMSLAVAAQEAGRIAGAIDVVGISHFVTFLERTESYRRDLRRVEYGDERDPAMRAFLDRISPLTQAHRIRKPLLVVQGRNDPRVPWTEAEQIVARARAQGTPVWYLRAENEGHGFARRENADYQFYATVLFLRQTLLKETP